MNSGLGLKCLGAGFQTWPSRVPGIRHQGVKRTDAQRSATVHELPSTRPSGDKSRP